MIDIIIPNWNGRDFLDTCLSSLAGQDYRDFSVTVVDNGSNDGSVEFIRSCYPEIQLLSYPENKGFSCAVNYGIKNTKSPWVMLLNNDTEVHKHCLKEISRAINVRSDFDFFSLKMIDYRNRNKIDGAGDAVLRGGVGYRLGTMESDSVLYSQGCSVFGACAGAAVYRRSLFDTVGLFDEDFFAYLEDVDWNMRAARAGFKCYYLPEAKVFHIGSASSGSKINDFTVSLSTRNNIFVIAKNYTPLMMIRFLPAIIVYQLFWLVFVLKHRQLKGYLKGIGRSMAYLPQMIRRRRRAMDSLSRESIRSFGDAIVASEKRAVQSIMDRRSENGKGNRLLAVYQKLFC